MEVFVRECNKLTSLSSLSHGHILKSLTKLKIYDCLQLEDTFPISVAQGLPLLNEVVLKNLPQFKGRDGNEIVLALSSLQKLKVVNCPELTPFIISTKIQELTLTRMKEMKKMSNMMGRGGSSVSTEYLKISNFRELFDSSYNLSSLKFLNLFELTELRVIWNGPIQAVNFQNLTELEVRTCRSLRYLFSPTIAQYLPRLSQLHIFDCEELEQIIDKDQKSSQHHLQPICFPRLAEVEISLCENLKYLFPITSAHGGLPKLKRIRLEDVPKLEQVFEGDEANVSKDEEEVIHLPQLTNLDLDWLPNLMSFSPVGYHFVFPSLENLTVQDCPNLTTRFSVDSEQSVHAETQASQSVDETIVEESATAQETTWPSGSNIRWRA